MQNRYGSCQDKHAESFLKSKIKVWAREREYFDDIHRSEAEIAQIVNEQFEAIIKGDSELACIFANCDKRFD